MNVFPLAVVLQHYLPDEIKDPALVWVIFECLFGTLTINSLSSQFKASHMRSRCSRLTLSTNSWYKSLIVLGLIPVTLAKSAWVHLASPSFVDSKILIIRRCSFRFKISFFDTFMCLLLFYSDFCYILPNYDIFRIRTRLMYEFSNYVNKQIPFRRLLFSLYFKLF